MPRANCGRRTSSGCGKYRRKARSGCATSRRECHPDAGATNGGGVMMGQSFGSSATVVARLRFPRTVTTPPVEHHEHLSGIFAEGEQSPDRTVREFRIVRSMGSREVTRDLIHDSLAARASTSLRSNGCPLRSLMTLSNFTQHAEQSHATPWSPLASWVRTGAPRGEPQPRIHEIDAPASRFARMAYRPFRCLPWAQVVTGLPGSAPSAQVQEC